MNDIMSITTKDLRSNLSDVLGRAAFGKERIGITRNGRLAAAIVSLDDLAALEAYEERQDLASYRRAKRLDGGERVSWRELKRELDEKVRD